MSADQSRKRLVVKLGAGLIAAGALMGMGVKQGEAYDIAVHNAFVAAEHAEIDGGVSTDGYLPLPEESRSGLEIAELEPSRPEDSGAAVTAHQTRAAVWMEVANDYKTDIRWWWGGAGAVLLLTASGTYVEVMNLRLRRRRANVASASDRRPGSPTHLSPTEIRSLEENRQTHSDGPDEAKLNNQPHPEGITER